MNQEINFTDEELTSFIRLMNELSGNDLSEKKAALSVKLKSFLKDYTQVSNFKEFLLRLQYDKKLRQDTIDFITVNETYFYRELSQLKEALYYLKSLDRKVNILCAPCSSGEEVYTLALLAISNFTKDSLQILGIDINSKAIQKAKEAVYQGRSLHRLSEGEKSRYFQKDGNTYTLKTSELCRCRFELCNVFDKKFLELGKFDVIFSRNMMIYFDYESRLKFVENLHKVANFECRLYIGNADLMPDTEYWSKVFMPRGGTYYIKN